MPKTNKWYFWNDKEVVELEPYAGNSYWMCHIENPNRGQVDSWEESSRLFDTKRECLEYAIGVISSKRLQLQVLENKLNSELVSVILGEIK